MSKFATERSRRGGPWTANGRQQLLNTTSNVKKTMKTVHARTHLINPSSPRAGYLQRSSSKHVDGAGVPSALEQLDQAIYETASNQPVDNSKSRRLSWPVFLLIPLTLTCLTVSPS